MSADHAHDDHGHGHGSRFIQHHYDDAQHQFDSGKLGIWLFLGQEVLFFSALFVAYVLYRYHHPEIYAYAHKYLDVKMGAINTAVLIFSSMTAAWAVRAAQKAQRTLLIVCIFVTLLCACTFLCVKYLEYSHKYHEQLLFGRYFDPCVGALEQPLVTKKNQCPGHETSVWFENNQAQTGCLPDIELDQDPDRHGLQLSCQVHEAVLEPKQVPKQQAKKDAKGQDVKGADGKPEMEPIKDKDGKVSMETATDDFRRWIFEEKEPGKPVKQCPKEEQHGEHEACWMPSYQPAVCRPGFYFSVGCTPGAPCAADWPRKAKDGWLAPRVSGRYQTIGDCEQDRFDRNFKIGKEAKADKDAGRTPSGLTVTASCVHSESIGFVVDYGDHKEREETRAVPVCEPPGKPAPPPDLNAPPQAPKLGEKAVVTGPVVEVDEFEQFEAGPPPDHTNMFFTIYFAMTGLHGIHVFVGVIVFIWLLIRAIKGHFTPDYFGPVDFAALYWHIVDLIWIFLFPLLYLIH